MTTLDARSQQQIIELLSPLMASEQDRRSLLIFAFGSNHPLVQQIDFSGTVASFVLELVAKLIDFVYLWNCRQLYRQRFPKYPAHLIDFL